MCGKRRFFLSETIISANLYGPCLRNKITVGITISHCQQPPNSSCAHIWTTIAVMSSLKWTVLSSVTLYPVDVPKFNIMQISGLKSRNWSLHWRVAMNPAKAPVIALWIYSKSMTLVPQFIFSCGNECKTTSSGTSPNSDREAVTLKCTMETFQVRLEENGGLIAISHPLLVSCSESL